MYSKSSLFCTILLCVLCSFFHNTIHGQEYSGLKLGTYSGPLSTNLNPSWSANSPLSWNFTPAAVGGHFYTDHAYLIRTDLLSLSQMDELALFDYVEGDQVLEADVLFNYFSSTNRRKAIVSGTVYGPSFQFKLKNWVFGIGLQARLAADATGIEPEYRHNPDTNLVLIDGMTKPLRAKVASWRSYHFNVSKAIWETQSEKIVVGGTLSYLEGMMGARIQLMSSGTHSLTTDTSSFSGLELAYTLPVELLDGEDVGSSDVIRNRGMGFGLDLGVQYQRNLNRDHRKFSVGVSLIDVGGFGLKRNMTTRVINSQTGGLIEADSMSNFESASDFESYFEDELLAGASAQTSEEGMFVGLPTALSIQASYTASKYFTVRTVLTQRLRFNSNQLVRENSWIVDPKLENRWFALALPVTMTEYRSVRLGASARLGIFILGTENLPSLLGNTPKFHHADLYAGVDLGPVLMGLQKLTREGRRGANKYGCPALIQ